MTDAEEEALLIEAYRPIFKEVDQIIIDELCQDERTERSMDSVDKLIANSLHRHFAKRNGMTEDEWTRFLDEDEAMADAEEESILPYEKDTKCSHCGHWYDSAYEFHICLDKKDGDPPYVNPKTCENDQ